MRLAAALIVAALSAPVRADSVTNQVIVSSTQATEANPRATVFTDMLNSSIDIGDDWSVSAGASLTLQGQTPAASRGQFGESGSAVTLFSAGADWSATDQVTISATVDVSPQSTQLAGTPVTLRQANGNELSGDADVSLLADGYLYDEDPAKIGYFGLAALGRGPGLPIAPLQYRIRPEVQHRMGDFSARLWVEAGEYVPGTGDSTAGIGTRLQYRFTKAFRAWLTLAGQRDVDSGGHVTRSGSVAAGAGLRW